MGWLGWPPETAMAADVNAIQIAMTGRISCLRAIGMLAPAEEKPAPLSYSGFREFAKRHNAARAVKRERKAASPPAAQVVPKKVKARGR